LTNLDEFIPCPKVFDYSHYEHGPKVHYVEPCINKELALPNGESPIDNWEDFLAEHDKIVFVTAGSQILDYKDKAVVLFQSIIGAMQASDMKGYHLIICAGSTLVQELSSDYENVTICGWAPQHTILSTLAQSKHKGSCAIIHGGLATIKECVYYEVPFLVLPLGKDQMDNALRLEDCGINNRFHLEYIKPKCLRYFINQILQDYKSRLNLKKLSGVFHKSEESHIGANAIAHLATNGNLDGFEW
jgi:UDP:flavonoid glycosyltransferase YjiC (YdhE family)